jgi:hypothetical protein
MGTKTQSHQCEQKQLDLRKLIDDVREKLRSGVELSDGSTVVVNPSIYHFSYAKLHGDRAKVVYVTGYVSMHIDVAISDGDVKISDVRLYNLCSDNYGV